MTTERHSGAIPGPMEHTEEWYAYRRYDPSRDKPVVFGASDAAAACARSHYQTPLDLFLKKRGELVERERSDAVQKRLRRGRRIQPVLISEYAEERGVEVIEPLRMFFHPECDVMSCTPDGIAMPSNAPRYGVECKGTSPQMYAAVSAMDTNRYGDDGTDVVPDDVLFQCQQQLECMDWDRVDVVVFFGLFVMRTYPVHRNDMLINAIRDAEQELAERIVDGVAPEPHWTHPNTRELISQVYGLRADSMAQMGEDELSLWLQYKKLGQDIKELDKQRDECRNRILWSMGDAELGRFPRGEKELRRVVVKDSLYTEDDAQKALARIGQVKRKGHERLLERKVKT